MIVNDLICQGGVNVFEKKKCPNSEDHVSQGMTMFPERRWRKILNVHEQQSLQPEEKTSFQCIVNDRGRMYARVPRAVYLHN
jgi:hypothetical protein